MPDKPRDRKPSVEEVNQMLAQVLAEKGYIVIATKADRLPYVQLQPVYELFGIPQGDDYIVDAFTDFGEYFEQMKHFAEIRPEFPFKMDKCVEEKGQHFYRVVKAKPEMEEVFDMAENKQLRKFAKDFHVPLGAAAIRWKQLHRGTR